MGIWKEAAEIKVRGRRESFTRPFSYPLALFAAFFLLSDYTGTLLLPAISIISHRKGHDRHR